MTKDFLGQEIFIGDEVVYVERKGGTSLKRGIISDIKPPNKFKKIFVTINLKDYDVSKSVIKIKKEENITTINKEEYSALINNFKMCNTQDNTLLKLAALYNKGLDDACAKLESFDCLYGDLKQAEEWKKEILEKAIKGIKDEVKK